MSPLGMTSGPVVRPDLHILKPGGQHLVGLIPYFLQANDPRPAAEQINERYQHGGGWNNFSSAWKMREDHSIVYPGSPEDGEPDEIYRPVASMHLPLTNEDIYIYPLAWVSIVQADGSFQISRMD